VTDQENVIDLVPYLDQGSPPLRETFAVYGGTESASRMALPVWRSVYRMRGERGAVVAIRNRGAEVRTIFVLDLAADPARTDLPRRAASLSLRSAPGNRLVCCKEDGWAAVYAGQRGGEAYYMMVFGIEDATILEEDDVRRDVLFLAGECASLVLHWGLDRPFGRRRTAPGEHRGSGSG